MSRLVKVARCPQCGKALTPSEVAGYVYQCVECDEDFYEFEAEYESAKARDEAISEDSPNTAGVAGLTAYRAVRESEHGD